MEIIRVEGLAKSYDGHQVHKDLTLSIKKGECFTLLGPSGCGKTVLLRLIAGFETPDAGRILIDNQVVSDPAAGINISPDIRGIGVVFQDYAVWPHMSVFDNVGFPLKIAKRPQTELKTRVMETLELVGMGNLAHRLPSELSGGQQQRVALARAIVANSSLMLLDEPLSNLDANLREEMRFEIKDLQRKYGFSIIYVTHDQAEAMALSDRILVMKLGVVQQIDTPFDVYNKPANKFVFSFIGLSNFLDVVWSDDKAYVRGETTALPLSLFPPESMRGSAGLSLASRPSEIDFVSDGEPDVLQGVVSRKAFLGEIVDYQVKIGGQELRIQKGRRTRGPELGENCRLRFARPFWYSGEE